MKKNQLLLCGLTLAMLAASTGTRAQNASCDRACLAQMLDDYLEAVVAHDPTNAPLFVGFRQTENARVVPLGRGVWASASALGAMQRRFFDPVTGNAAYFGVLEEGDLRGVATVRVHVERGEITEAEWHIGRRNDAGIRGEPGGVLFDADNLIANGPPQRTVARNERVSREALIAITNSYFDGITNEDASIIQAHGGCVRLENGLRVTGRELPAERASDGFEGRSDCTSGQGNFDVVFVAARRFSVVDVEAQVVIASAVFVRKPGNDKRRNHFAETFYIDGGKIRGVYASMFYADPLQPVPNWPPYDGNFPLPADFGATR